MTLSELKVGQSALIIAVGGEGALRQHLLDMGIIPNSMVRLVKFAPLGDPMEVRVHDYNLTLRKADASLIEVEPCEETEVSRDTDSNRPYIDSLPDHNSHPGLGETGKYHNHETENPLPKGTKLNIVLVGQKNCGKTALFNRLTGLNQHAGNFPGITIERTDGAIVGQPDAVVTDLPGIYSLSPHTEEERLSCRCIIGEKPKAIINIVDANNIEHNLYLTMQLMELDIPMVLALNMMDEVRNNGGSIRVNEMEKIMGIPVVAVSSVRGEGLTELVEHAIHVAKYQETPARHDFCDKDDHEGAVHRCLHSIMHLIEDHALRAGLPLRYAASKLAEGDLSVAEVLELSQNEKETLEHLILQMEEERGMDRSAAMADMRFTFIRKLCRQTVTKPKESKEYQRSRRIDRILTGKYTAIPIFILVMVMVIWLSIDVIGSPLQELLSRGIGWLGDVCGNAMTRWEVNPVVRSLVVDGVFCGVGSVLSFVPIIVSLFFFLSLLEDSGYMSRVAFVSDTFLRKLGLTGHSIVPMLTGFGCTVPAVMATRTLPSAHDRWRTILLIPFMSCSAKIPVYALFTSVFFPDHAALVLIGLYLLGIAVGLLTALIIKWINKESKAAPFVMEIPNYRLPNGKNVGHLLWDKTKDFLRNAFTVIFMASLVIWFLRTFDFHFHVVENGNGCILSSVAGWIAPVFEPLGLGEWQIVTALISGVIAKESVIASIEMLGGMSLLTTLSAVSMLVFCLLYTPCVASIAAIRRELGGKWAFYVVIFQCIVAWIAAWAVYSLLGVII